MGRISIYLGAADKDLELWYESISDKSKVKDVLNRYRLDNHRRSSSDQANLEVKDIEKLCDELKCSAIQERNERMKIYERLDTVLQMNEALSKMNLALQQELMGLRMNDSVREVVQMVPKIEAEPLKSVVVDEPDLDTISNVIDFGGLMDG
jgi:hypothetical protein